MPCSTMPATISSHVNNRSRWTLADRPDRRHPASSKRRRFLPQSASIGATAPKGKLLRQPNDVFEFEQKGVEGLGWRRTGPCAVADESRGNACRRQGVERNDAENFATHRQPARAQVVTYVLSTFCYPCVQGKPAPPARSHIGHRQVERYELQARLVSG
jgi:hypothetical protein